MVWGLKKGLGERLAEHFGVFFYQICKTGPEGRNKIFSTNFPPQNSRIRGFFVFKWLRTLNSNTKFKLECIFLKHIAVDDLTKAYTIQLSGRSFWLDGPFK